MAVSQVNPHVAFLRFHLNVGARLAAKTLAPLLAFFFSALYLLKVEFFIVMARAVFLDSHSIVSGLIYAVIALCGARIMAPRVCLGLNGWIRHLPLKSMATRRLALLSIFIAQLPLLCSLAVPSLLLSLHLGINPVVYFAGLPVLGLSSSLFVLPVKRGFITKPIVLAASILAASGNGWLLSGGFFLFLVSESLSGPLAAGKQKQKRKQLSRGLWVNAFIAWRALKWRTGVPYVLSFFILFLTQVFIENNDAGVDLSEKMILFGGACCMVVLCAFLAHLLAVRRPPWPWSRTLPWSSHRRVLIDAGLFALAAVPLLLSVAMMEIKTVMPLLLGLPLLCCFSSWTVRRLSSERRTGAYGSIILYGGTGAVLLSLLPLISIIYLLLVPFLFKQAVQQERNIKVSLWMERHHLAAGDSLSWSQK